MIISSFIIQANVITIVNYDRQTFIVQATERMFTFGNIANFRSTYSTSHPLHPSTKAGAYLSEALCGGYTPLGLLLKLMKFHFLTHPTQATWYTPKRQAFSSTT
jgi:hypothetical protein